MGRLNIPVAPMSGNDIEAATMSFLSSVVPENLKKPTCLNVEELLELHINRHHHFKVRLCHPSEIDGDEARVDIANNAIWMTHAVHDGIVSGNGRDRFTACHEAVHVLVHVPQIRSWNKQHIERAVLMSRGGTKIPVFKNPEWQAEYGGGCLLMPEATIRNFIKKLYEDGVSDENIIKEISLMYKVSNAAASKRFSIIKKKTPGLGTRGFFNKIE